MGCLLVIIGWALLAGWALDATGMQLLGLVIMAAGFMWPSDDKEKE